MYFDPEIIRVALEVEEEAESGLFTADQFGGYAVTFLFTIINVLVAYLVIKKFVFKPVMGILKNREDKIRASLEEAEKAASEAKENAEISKKAIEDARIEASEIIESSKENAEKQAEVIKGKADEEANEIVSRAEADAKRIKRVALEEMKDEISDLAVTISGKILGEVVSEESLKEMSDKYTDEVLKEEVNKLG